MSGGGFILAINLSVAALVAAALLFIAAYDRKATAPRWLVVSCVMGMAYGCLEFAVGLLPAAPIIVISAYMSLALGLGFLNVGLARKYAQPVPEFRIVGLLVLALATILIYGSAPRLSLLPMLAYQLPYALLEALGAITVLRSHRKRALDYVLVSVLLLSALQFLCKPLIGLALGSIGDTAAAYMSTLYALFSQTISAIFFLALALTLIVIMMRDLLSAMAATSETDALSGVLNRRGFEQRAEPVLRACEASRIPLTLILCDLDHFKSVNDTYGHATGDLVIAGFARQLTVASTSGQIIGRMGGEEFALIYPGANLPSARVFAEALRSGFASLAIPGAPPGRTFTASFGVAELQHGETLSELMGRADAALYGAKTAGRDCVRIAAPVVISGNIPMTRMASGRRA